MCLDVSDEDNTGLMEHALRGRPSAHEIEMPACNGLSNAHGLARCAAVLAGRGHVGDTQVLSESTWQESMAGEVKMFDGILGVRFYNHYRLLATWGYPLSPVTPRLLMRFLIRSISSVLRPPPSHRIAESGKYLVSNTESAFPRVFISDIEISKR